MNDDLITVLAPIVIGAVVAGISALVKGAVERRDARVTAERQLGLAISRTAFVKEWLAVSNNVSDPVYAQEAAIRAKAELEQAYKEANEALARGQSVIEERWGDKLVDQLRWLLLIRHGHTAAARGLVVAFYILVVLIWIGMLAPEEAGDPDAAPLWQDALVASIATIVLRALAGFGVRALDARRRPSAATRVTAPATSSGASSDTAVGPSSPLSGT